MKLRVFIYLVIFFLVNGLCVKLKGISYPVIFIITYPMFSYPVNFILVNGLCV